MLLWARNVWLHAGNVLLWARNVWLHTGNVLLWARNVWLHAGNVLLRARNVRLHAGNVATSVVSLPASVLDTRSLRLGIRDTEANCKNQENLRSLHSFPFRKGVNTLTRNAASDASQRATPPAQAPPDHHHFDGFTTNQISDERFETAPLLVAHPNRLKQSHYRNISMPKTAEALPATLAQR